VADKGSEDEVEQFAFQVADILTHRQHNQVSISSVTGSQASVPPCRSFSHGRESMTGFLA